MIKYFMWATIPILLSRCSVIGFGFETIFLLLLRRARVVAILCRARYSQSRVAGRRVGEEDSGMKISVCEVFYQIVAPWQGLTMSVSHIRTPVIPHPDSCPRKSCIIWPWVTKSCKLCGAESARCGAAWRRELQQSAYSPALLTRGSDLFLVLSAASSEHYFGIAFLRKSANSKLFLSGVYSCAELAGGERVDIGWSYLPSFAVGRNIAFGIRSWGHHQSWGWSLWTFIALWNPKEVKYTCYL